MLFEFSLLHQARGLLPRAAQNQSPAGGVHGVGKIFESLQAGGVDGGHIAEAKDDDRRQAPGCG